MKYCRYLVDHKRSLTSTSNRFAIPFKVFQSGCDALEHHRLVGCRANAKLLCKLFASFLLFNQHNL